MEGLERREVPATFQVQDVADLIASINAANANGDERNVIELGPGTYTLTEAQDNWFGPNGLPTITSDLTIVGNGAVITCAPTQYDEFFRIFCVSGGPGLGGLPLGSLTLEGLTLSGGVAQGGDSGTGGGGMGAGGAIFNMGTVNLVGVTIAGNSAIGGSSDGSVSTSGGGIGEDSQSDGGGGFGPLFTPGSNGGAGGLNGPDGAGGGGGFSAAGGSAPGESGGGGGAGGGLSQLGGAGGNSPRYNDPGGAGGDGGGGGAGAFPYSLSYGGDFGQGGMYSGPFYTGVNRIFFYGGGGGGVGGGGAGGGVFTDMHKGKDTGGGGGGFGGGGGAGNGAGGWGGFGGGGGGGYGHGGYGGGSGSGTTGGGGAGMGGAIFNLYGSVSMVNSTLTQNSAVGGGGMGYSGSGLGGAVFNLNGTLTIVNSTLANNALGFYGSSSGDGQLNGAAVYSLTFGFLPTGEPTSSAVNVGNSILAATSTSAIAPIVSYGITGPSTINAIGPNLATKVPDLSAMDLSARRAARSAAVGGSTLFSTGSAAGSFVGVPFTIGRPWLAPLRSNGGLVPTMRLLRGSRAIDAGDPGLTARDGLALDARGDGFQRWIGRSVDLGAFEYQPPTTSTTLAIGPDAGPTGAGAGDRLTARVIGVAPGSNIPRGFVIFRAGRALLGRAPLVDGVASLSVPTRHIQGRPVIARYVGAIEGRFDFAPSVSDVVWRHRVGARGR